MDHRWWLNVDVRGPDECWPWKGATTPKGYGDSRLTLFGVVWRLAHRIANVLTFGPLDEGQQVLHECDNPPCCNPRHHFRGTNDDNVADKLAKGRGASLAGEAHPMVKLSQEQVNMVKARYKPRHPVDGARAMARELGVSHGAISHILTERSW